MSTTSSIRAATIGATECCAPWRAHQVDRPVLVEEFAGVERVVVDPGRLEDHRVGEAVEGPSDRGPDRVPVPGFDLSRCGQVLVPSPRRARMARQDADRLTSRRPTRPVEELFDAQALQGGGVEIGADDRRRHLLPVRPAAVDCRSDPGEAGEPSSTQDGRLGNLAALDRVPAQLLRSGDEALGVKDMDRSHLGSDCGCVHVGVMARGGHHCRTLVAQHRRDHEPFALADSGHTDGEDVVLGLGEQPGAGGDVDPERQRFAPRDCVLPVEGGGVALECSAAHPPLDLCSIGFRRTSVWSTRRSDEVPDQTDGHDDEHDHDELRDEQRGPQGHGSGQRRAVDRDSTPSWDRPDDASSARRCPLQCRLLRRPVRCPPKTQEATWPPA